MKVFVVRGTHFVVPNVRQVVCSRMDGPSGARAEALNMVNILRKDMGLPEASDPEKFKDALKEARAARAKQVNCLPSHWDLSAEDIDDLLKDLPPEDDANVWIETEEAQALAA